MAMDFHAAVWNPGGILGKKVIRHYDAKRKWCPRKMMDSPELWTDFCLRIRGQEEEVKSFEDGAGNWHFTIRKQQLTSGFFFVMRLF